MWSKRVSCDLRQGVNGRGEILDFVYHFIGHGRNGVNLRNWRNWDGSQFLQFLKLTPFLIKTCLDIMGKRKTKLNKQNNTYICPVCSKPATSSTFICTSCKPPQYVHYVCGGYSGYKQVKDMDQGLLTCINCKVRFFRYLILYRILLIHNLFSLPILFWVVMYVTTVCYQISMGIHPVSLIDIFGSFVIT